MKFSVVILFIVLLAATWFGCSNQGESEPGANVASISPVEATPQARRMYPNLESLYGGDHGIYRGCGPNNGVCHNSREFPNMSSLGSLVENIGVRCNEKRDDPTQIHDLCERQGDLLRVGEGPAVEIAAVIPYADSETSRVWRVRLREPVAITPSARVTVVRPGSPTDIEFVSLTDFAAAVTVDGSDATGRTLHVTLPPKPVSTEAGEEAEDDLLGPLFAKAGVPGDPLSIQVGDPNQNGVFGAALGGRLIVPGDPAKSYLITRLTDPTAGPVMPRANCCFWTKATLRAFWCWVAGLEPDGRNALDPIAYDRCPPGPPDTVDYPEPGPACETSGLCPVKAKGAISDEASFANVYDNVIRHSCAGSACHVGGNAAGLDMTTKERAHAALVGGGRVVPGDPAKSRLFIRISPELCKGDCSLMPKGMPPLDGRTRNVIERWIQGGAALD
jgi:hypothetical protein